MSYRIPIPGPLQASGAQGRAGRQSLSEGWPCLGRVEHAALRHRALPPPVGPGVGHPCLAPGDPEWGPPRRGFPDPRSAKQPHQDPSLTEIRVINLPPCLFASSGPWAPSSQRRSARRSNGRDQYPVSAQVRLRLAERWPESGVRRTPLKPNTKIKSMNSVPKLKVYT